MHKEVIGAIVCALAVLAAGVWLADQHRDGPAAQAAASALAVETPGAFTGGGALDEAQEATHAARRTARGTRKRAVSAPPATVAHVRRGRKIRLFDGPGGRPLTEVDSSTPFGSRRSFAVVRREGGWLGVLSSVLDNGVVGWIRNDSAALRIERHSVRLVVDRSERRLDLLRGRRRVMSVPVGVGRPGSETPLGRFAVTDRLTNGRFSRSYGCCILALSGRQTRLPAGWRGGDRLALHGTDRRRATDTRTAGCIAVDEAPVRRLMRSVPLGTLVTIRP